MPKAAGGSAARVDLWGSGDCALWESLLGRYEERLVAVGGEKLRELDAWYRGDFPRLMRSRKPPHVEPEELVRVTEWKMRRGIFRPRNLALVRGNPADQVVRVTAQALAADKPLPILTQLAGVGAATASAVVSVIDADAYPFFDEVVSDQVPGLGPCKFTVPFYLKYACALRGRAAELSRGCDRRWTADEVGQALWANH